MIEHLTDTNNLQSSCVSPSHFIAMYPRQTTTFPVSSSATAVDDEPIASRTRSKTRLSMDSWRIEDPLENPFDEDPFGGNNPTSFKNEKPVGAVRIRIMRRRQLSYPPDGDYWWGNDEPNHSVSSYSPKVPQSNTDKPTQ